MAKVLELNSNEISVSTKEFLQFEKTCERYKDSDDEIKLIFSEINKLSNANVILEDTDDIELILKKAEDIAHETESLLKNSPVKDNHNDHKLRDSPGKIPEIKVTTAENEPSHKLAVSQKENQPSKQNTKEPDARRKPKQRPFSASVIDFKKRETSKVIPKSVSNLPKKQICKHENVLEELKDTNERVKSLELLNVKLNDDNKALRKALEEVNNVKRITELKLLECEKFVARLGNEYEHRNSELKSVKENEAKLVAELNKERNDRKNLIVQREKDVVVIHDLQRQVKEMEMILKRKHPDSVSALIVAAKSSTVEDNKKKLLEERIARLELELKDKEGHFQGILLTLQEKFGDMKQKYESHIIDVERQLMEDRKVNAELKNKINKSNLVDTAVQTISKNQNTVSSQTFVKADRASSAASSRLSQNSALLLNKLKEDSYLCATIKSLQAELTVKQRTIAKINRETEELKKNLRSLQKEKEVLLNLNPQKKTFNKHTKSVENVVSKVNLEMEMELIRTKKTKDDLLIEKNDLLEALKRSNEEFIMLKKKRIQDLHILQLAHEKELMQMNMQIYPLQEEIKLLNRTVEILQERVRSTEDKLLRYQASGREIDNMAGGDNCCRGKH